jgi:hypothetical protein
LYRYEALQGAVKFFNDEESGVGGGRCDEADEFEKSDTWWRVWCIDDED